MSRRNQIRLEGSLEGGQVRRRAYVDRLKILAIGKALGLDQERQQPAKFTVRPPQNRAERRAERRRRQHDVDD